MSLDLTSRPVTALPADVQVLGSFRLGNGMPAELDWPVQDLALPLLSTHSSWVAESWLVEGSIQAGEGSGLRWRRVGDVLFGVVTLDESAFADAASPLQAASEAAYLRIFRLLGEQGLSQLWRVWNYMARINDEHDGLERYRQFNVGRQEAFLETDHGVTGNVPAACAIGLADGPLSIAFLAGATPPVPIENPRQVSAYHYPSDYGPRSPTFSRAALVYPPGREILFVSGTASILGHRTVHVGDVAGQCRESLDNIAAVLAEANLVARQPGYALDKLLYRVYVRHASDYPVVRDMLAARLGNAECLCVQADICRADLLIEIEAMALHAWEE